MSKEEAELRLAAVLAFLYWMGKTNIGLIVPFYNFNSFIKI